jgi:tRNA(Ile)-lysidine synthase
MKYLVAVSGGIDSVVLLHKLVAAGEHELVVAHFDHGIREDSAEDARFVKGLAEHYGLPFVMKREELGKTAGEEQARTRRYAFYAARQRSTTRG